MSKPDEVRQIMSVLAVIQCSISTVSVSVVVIIFSKNVQTSENASIAISKMRGHFSVPVRALSLAKILLLLLAKRRKKEKERKKNDAQRRKSGTKKRGKEKVKMENMKFN